MRHLSAPEAAAALGVKLPTLYAYVSRGLLRSEGAGRAQGRRYSADDVAALRQRRRQRRDPAVASEGALHFGLPVLDSALTLIQDGRLFYRGHDAIALAGTRTVEQVAGLLWTGRADTATDAAVPDLPRDVWRQILSVTASLPPALAFQVGLPIAAAHDPAAYDLRPEAVERSGARIMRLLTAIAVRQSPGTRSVSVQLARRWAPRIAAAEGLLRTTLVLLADHELNVSTFTARAVASAGGNPYAVVAGGLAAVQGFRHGAASERVQGLLTEIGTPAQARSVVEARLRRGERLPGFGHQLYPGGDPRAARLLSLIEQQRGLARAAALPLTMIAEVSRLVSVRPNVDAALVALAYALHLPPSAPLTLFALGRTVGWIGHALEQYADDRLFRPRARYVGPTPIS